MCETISKQEKRKYFQNTSYMPRILHTLYNLILTTYEIGVIIQVLQNKETRE